jgi:hypothetical protein
MSCRHDLAGATCSRCYPGTGTWDPAPESHYPPNLEGPGAITFEEYKAKHPEATQMAVCCYCMTPVPVVHFNIPPGYAKNPVHDKKPLCDECGGKATPSLDAILAALDDELEHDEMDARLRKFVQGEGKST